MEPHIKQSGLLKNLYMNLLITKLNKNLDNQLQIINLEEQDILKKAQKSIHCIKRVLKDLKAFVLAYNFIDEAEEIYFFKKINPNYSAS